MCVTGAWGVTLGAALVIAAGLVGLGCETGQLLGEPCTRDDECISGLICRGAVCVEPLDLGRDPAQAGTPDAAPDVVDDVATDAAEDAPEEAAPDAPDEDAADEDAADDAAGDAPDDAADDAADDADDGG